jgi:ABC-2 type transport system ATP-binding protein
VLLGLVASDGDGDIRLLDKPVPAGLPEVIGGIGALVEAPLFFPNFTGRLNLRLLAETAGVTRNRVEECLEIVDLRDRAGDKFKSYSLGMKQRLGIAAALLKSPRLLILDEPSNGLDPAGIRDVRELIRRLGRDGGTTIFLSSHLLAEIQQVADHVSILARGRRVASGPVAEVLAGAASADVRVRVPDPAAAAAVLTDAGFRISPGTFPDGSPDWSVIVVHAVASPSEINRLLAGHGHWLEELSPVHADLETAFLALTEAAEGTPPGPVPAGPGPSGPASSGSGS